MGRWDRCGTNSNRQFIFPLWICPRNGTRRPLVQPLQCSGCEVIKKACLCNDYQLPMPPLHDGRFPTHFIEAFHRKRFEEATPVGNRGSHLGSIVRLDQETCSGSPGPLPLRFSHSRCSPSRYHGATVCTTAQGTFLPVAARGGDTKSQYRSLFQCRMRLFFSSSPCDVGYFQTL